MKVIQIIKKLNNTELGKGGTHETYVLVPQDLEISDLFPEKDVAKEFVYKKTGKTYHIRYTLGREKRIVGLGDFYRDNDVCAGDEMIFEKYITDGNSSYYIDLNKRSDIVMLQRCRKGFEVLTQERKKLFTRNMAVFSNGDWANIELEFIGAEKKRQDSPVTTDIYDLKVNGSSIVKDFTGKEMVEIQVNTNNEKALINRICSWKKYVFKMEGQNE